MQNPIHRVAVCIYFSSSIFYEIPGKFVLGIYNLRRCGITLFQKILSALYFCGKFRVRATAVFIVVEAQTLYAPFRLVDDILQHKTYSRSIEFHLVQCKVPCRRSSSFTHFICLVFHKHHSAHSIVSQKQCIADGKDEITAHRIAWSKLHKSSIGFGVCPVISFARTTILHITLVVEPHHLVYIFLNIYRNQIYGRRGIGCNMATIGRMPESTTGICTLCSCKRMEIFGSMTLENIYTALSQFVCRCHLFAKNKLLLGIGKILCAGGETYMCRHILVIVDSGVPFETEFTHRLFEFELYIVVCLGAVAHISCGGEVCVVYTIVYILHIGTTVQ